MEPEFQFAAFLEEAQEDRVSNFRPSAEKFRAEERGDPFCRGVGDVRRGR